MIDPKFLTIVRAAIAAKQIPKKSFVQIANELSPASGDISEKISAGTINFVYWNGAPFGDEPIFKFSDKDISEHIEWK